MVANYICAFAGVVAVIIMGLDLFRPRKTNERITESENRLFKMAMASFLLLPIGAANSAYELFRIDKTAASFEFALLSAVVVLSCLVARKIHVARGKQWDFMSGQYLENYKIPTKRLLDIETYKSTLLD